MNDLASLIAEAPVGFGHQGVDACVAEPEPLADFRVRVAGDLHRLDPPAAFRQLRERVESLTKSRAKLDLIDWVGNPIPQPE